ncbi:hypothetical protein [Lysobacter sp. CA199]|uniref:hypothetical protein n=1 Tax=Lysobacter sp. CA199 TaxID=3455608 RepID=UPI003F8D5374
MTDKTESTTDAKLEALVKPTKTAKAELPANVVKTELAHGTVLLNATAVERN